MLKVTGGAVLTDTGRQCEWSVGMHTDRIMVFVFPFLQEELVIVCMYHSCGEFVMTVT